MMIKIKKTFLLLFLLLFAGCSDQSEKYLKLDEDIITANTIPNSLAKTINWDTNQALDNIDELLARIALVIDKTDLKSTVSDFDYIQNGKSVVISAQGYKLSDSDNFDKDFEALDQYLKEAGFITEESNPEKNETDFKQKFFIKKTMVCRLQYEQQVLSIFCGLLSETETSGLNQDEAFEIAQSSECVDEGELKPDTAFYNENSQTWWFDLQTDKEGCNPACVVHSDKTSEINWRCTGLIPQGN